MLKQKINRGFTIIEILVVIIVIIIFVFIAWPNITNWTTEREVRQEVNSFVEYLEEKKAEVQEGKYPVVSVGVYASPVLWYMTHEEYGIQMKVPAPARTNRGQASKYNNKSILNNARGCPGYPPTIDYQEWKESTDRYKWNNNVYHWPNVWLCISQNAIFQPGPKETHPTTGEKGYSRIIICSAKNTTKSGGPTRCNQNNKIDNRYMVWTDRSLKISIYKYNLKKDKWILK